MTFERSGGFSTALIRPRIYMTLLLIFLEIVFTWNMNYELVHPRLSNLQLGTHGVNQFAFCYLKRHVEEWHLLPLQR